MQLCKWILRNTWCNMQIWSIPLCVPNFGLMIIMLNLKCSSCFRFFLYVFLAAFVVLLLVGAQQFLTSFGVSTSYSKVLKMGPLGYHYSLHWHGYSRWLVKHSLKSNPPWNRLAIMHKYWQNNIDTYRCNLKILLMQPDISIPLLLIACLCFHLLQCIQYENFYCVVAEGSVSEFSLILTGALASCPQTTSLGPGYMFRPFTVGIYNGSLNLNLCSCRKNDFPSPNLLWRWALRTTLTLTMTGSLRRLLMEPVSSLQPSLILRTLWKPFHFVPQIALLEDHPKARLLPGTDGRNVALDQQMNRTCYRNFSN